MEGRRNQLHRSVRRNSRFDCARTSRSSACLACAAHTGARVGRARPGTRAFALNLPAVARAGPLGARRAPVVPGSPTTLVRSGIGLRDDTVRQLDQRLVDQLAVDRDCTVAGVLDSREHPAGPFELGRRWQEAGIDRRNLRGMDT